MLDSCGTEGAPPPTRPCPPVCCAQVEQQEVTSGTLEEQMGIVLFVLKVFLYLSFSTRVFISVLNIRYVGDKHKHFFYWRQFNNELFSVRFNCQPFCQSGSLHPQSKFSPSYFSFPHSSWLPTWTILSVFVHIFQDRILAASIAQPYFPPASDVRPWWARLGQAGSLSGQAECV